MKPFATKWHLTPPAGLDPDHQAVYDLLSGLLDLTLTKPT
jgi:hypothetical protein